jgi:hypothetical protein
MVPTKETNYVMHDNSDPLDTFVVGSGLENADSLSRGKTIVGGADGFGSSKLHTTPITPFERIGKESTTINLIVIAQIHSVESVDWAILQPRSSPSKKLQHRKGQLELKSPSKFVVEGENGENVD